MVPTEKPELTTTEARQGVTPHMTRYVLHWGTLGAVVVLFLAWLIFGG